MTQKMTHVTKNVIKQVVLPLWWRVRISPSPPNKKTAE
uniref:Uncharacterized protein n=1 Tax=Siphoviridae sp. ctiMP24 TaxID=2825621 RepID=A0A8S5P0R6_9CAUD|nr:MAG TPA: hypothetical protein [Siphoviridae sp. ctiMP24]